MPKKKLNQFHGIFFWYIFDFTSFLAWTFENFLCNCSITFLFNIVNFGYRFQRFGLGISLRHTWRSSGCFMIFWINIFTIGKNKNILSGTVQNFQKGITSSLSIRKNWWLILARFSQISLFCLSGGCELEGLV